MTCYKPSNVSKHFGHNIVQLKDTFRFKIWKYWINSAIVATGYTYLFMDKLKPEDNKVVYAIYVVIIDKIADYIITNYIHTRTLITTLMSSLEECFNSYTVMCKVYNKSLLFKYNNYIKNFRQTLDKLEQIYTQLITNNLKLIKIKNYLNFFFFVFLRLENASTILKITFYRA